MNFAYQGYDDAGSPVTGTIEATSPGEATHRLSERGLFVTDVSEAPQKREASSSRNLTLGRSGGLKDVVAFTRQVSVLTRTGTPVVQSIHAVERQLEEGPWREVVSQLRQRVEEGEALGDVMNDHPKSFDAVYRSLIAAGESGGNLPEMLDRLSLMTRQTLKIRNSVSGAMTYPLLLIGISLSVLTIMILFVLPRFAGLFDTLDAEIPASTQFLLTLGTFLRTQWWVLPTVIVTLVGGSIWAVRTPGPRAKIDDVMLNSPVIGKVIRSLTIARLARVLGVLQVSRVPLLDSLTLTGEAMRNARYRALIDEAIDAVTHGDSMSAVFRRSPLVPGAVTEALITGEQTGRIGEVLVNFADFMDEDNEVMVKSVTSLIEPLILIVLGGIVGFIAFSMFMPLFDLTAATGA